MQFINPDDEKELENFYREWNSCYTERNPIKPPSVVTMRILYLYATSGSIPGDFIMAILQNDLYGAFGTAPLDEIENIYGTVQYVTTYLSTEAWGNADKVGRWINRMKKSKSNRPTEFY